MDIDKHAKSYLIAPDGGLRSIPNYLVSDLQKKGWRMVMNPKRTYYAEYDQTNPHYKEKEEQRPMDELPIEVL